MHVDKASALFISKKMTEILQTNFAMIPKKKPELPLSLQTVARRNALFFIVPCKNLLYITVKKAFCLWQLWKCVAISLIPFIDISKLQHRNAVMVPLGHHGCQRIQKIKENSFEQISPCIPIKNKKASSQGIQN